MKKSIIVIFIVTLIIVLSCVTINNVIVKEEDIDVVNQQNINISARAAISYNATSDKIIYSKNIHKPLLTASIIKILTCITAIENIDINKYILIGDWINQAYGSSIYLKKGDYVKVIDLLYGLILESGNDAALALCYAYSPNPNDFIIKMQELVKKLHLTDTTISNPSGLDENSENYSSCYDMASITKYAFKNALFRKIFGTKFYTTTINDRLLSFHHKHKLVQNLPHVIGGKTGYTKKAGRTLVTIFSYDGEIIIVVTMQAGNDWLLHQELSKYDE